MKISAEKFDPAKAMRTHPALLDRRSNRLTIEQLKSTKLEIDEAEMNVKKKKIFDFSFKENFSFSLAENSQNEKEKVRRTSETSRTRKEFAASRSGDGKQNSSQSEIFAAKRREKICFFFFFFSERQRRKRRRFLVRRRTGKNEKIQNSSEKKIK